MNDAAPADGVRPPVMDLVVKKAGEWMAAPGRRPVPAMLFDEFWTTGGLSVLFGDVGVGKSVLALQIAESIASGRAIGPMRLTSPPRDVLYVDLKLDAGQFEMRYSCEEAADDGFVSSGHYTFSERLHRVEIPPDALRYGYKPIKDWIARQAAETGIDVVVIDNISLMRGSNQGSRDELPLMRELSRLKRETGLSILVLTGAVRRNAGREVSANDLHASRIICNYTDSVFAIGRNRGDSSVRYIKHIRSLNSEMIYDGDHVPEFRLTKIGGNFLGFEFEGFDDEAFELTEEKPATDWELIDEIKRRSAEGLSIRAIAAEMAMSKSTVHRMLERWEPPESEPEPTEPPVEAVDEPEPPSFDAEQAENEAYISRMEAYNARRAEMEQAAAAPEQAEPEIPKGPDLVETGPMAGLKPAIDANGREIFVEREDRNGRPRIWYQFDKYCSKRRWERTAVCSSGQKIIDPEHRASYRSYADEMRL